jgi:hypothetical protein
MIGAGGCHAQLKPRPGVEAAKAAGTGLLSRGGTERDGVNASLTRLELKDERRAGSAPSETINEKRSRQICENQATDPKQPKTGVFTNLRTTLEVNRDAYKEGRRDR